MSTVLHRLPPRPARPGVGLLVLLLHGALLLAWISTTSTTTGRRAADALTTWLLLPRMADPAPSAVAALPIVRTTPRPAARTEPAPITSPAATQAPGPVVDAAPVTAPAERGNSLGTPAAPLNLDLPRGWRGGGSASPAASAPGSSPRRPLTLEQRIAEAVGDGRWTLERIDDDRLRARDGNRCVTLTRARSDTLDPFNRAVSSKPWVASAPEPCSPTP